MDDRWFRLGDHGRYPARGNEDLVLRSRTFLTTTLGLLGAILGFTLSAVILISGAPNANAFVDWIDETISLLVGDTWSGVVFVAGMFLVTTFGLMFLGFSMAKRLAASSSNQLPNRPHPLD